MSYTPPSSDAIDFVRRKVAAGFHGSRADLEEAIDAAFYDDEAARDAALEALPVELLTRERAMKEWPVVTDCDRLDAAFARLEAHGIIARQDYTCCNTCGHYEIRDLLRSAARAERDVRGYVFFHMQDTDRVVVGEPLALRYGSRDRDAASDVAVGREIVSALRDEGLTATWNEDPATIIRVAPLQWQRKSAPRAWAPTLDDLETRIANALPGLVRARFVDVTGLLGPLYVLRGDPTRAFEWARAPSGSSTARRTSALACAAVAEACAHRADAARASDAWTSAFEIVPAIDDPAPLFSFVTSAPFEDARVLSVARTRVLATDQDLWGAAIAASFALRADALPREDRAHIAERAAAIFERTQPTSELRREPAAQRELARALVALEAKGVLEKAPEQAREKATTTDAATEDGEPAPATVLARRARAAMNRGAAADDAELLRDYEGAKQALDELATMELEGLIAPNEAVETRDALMMIAAYLGKDEETLANIRTIDRDARATPIPELVTASERLHDIANGSAPALATMKKDAPPDASFARAIERWSAARTKSDRFRARRFGRVILERAQSLAAQGDASDTAKLLDVLLPRDTPELGLLWADLLSRHEVLLTLTAIGRADEVVAIGREEIGLLELELCAHAIALAALGDKDGARARVCQAMNKPLVLSDLPLLAPALAAVADDPPSTARRLLAVISKGAAARDDIVAPP
jgi:hypothetical protein